MYRLRGANREQLVSELEKLRAELVLTNIRAAVTFAELACRCRRLGKVRLCDKNLSYAQAAFTSAQAMKKLVIFTPGETTELNRSLNRLDQALEQLRAHFGGVDIVR